MNYPMSGFKLVRLSFRTYKLRILQRRDEISMHTQKGQAVMLFCVMRCQGEPQGSDTVGLLRLVLTLPCQCWDGVCLALASRIGGASL